MFVNSTVFCDTFFVMGGMLVTCSMLRELERNNGKLNILRHYAHRFLRSSKCQSAPQFIVNKDRLFTGYYRRTLLFLDFYQLL